MVLVHYLGTGEAFDHGRPNTSFILEGCTGPDARPSRILFDCGYSIPHALWRVSTDPHYLDGIYLSHFHADHCFGLPAVLARLGQDGRRKSLTILGGPGVRQATAQVLELGYPGILRKLDFSLECTEICPGGMVTYGQWAFQTARSYHSLPNYSVRAEVGGISVCYSGDGSPSPDCTGLYANADLLIHEAYYSEPRAKRSHASIDAVLKVARDRNVQRLHLVHLSRSAARPTDLTLPEAGEIYEVAPAG